MQNESLMIMETFLKALLVTFIVSILGVYLGIITDWKERNIKIGLIIAISCLMILLTTIVIFLNV